MGEQLFGEVTEATGLPTDLIADELARLIEAAGVQKSEMTLEDLRRILAEYVQDVLVSVKDELSRSVEKKP